MGGKSSFGTVVGVSTLPATTYTPIECTTTVNMEDAETTTIDVTCLSSTARDKISGIEDSGTLTLDINVNFEDEGYAILKGSRASGDNIGFEIELKKEGTETKGRTFVFEGFVKSLPWQATIDSAITGNATIEITGPVVETPPVTP